MRSRTRRMILRTLAGFLSLWLLFAGVLSWNLLRQAQARALNELAQLLSRETVLRLDGSVLQTEEMAVLMESLCISDSRIKAGAVFRRHGSFGLLAESEYPIRILVREEDGEIHYAGFSPLDCMSDWQYDRLAALAAESYEAFQKTRSPEPEVSAAGRPALYASGWVSGDRLYPDRLAAAPRPYGGAQTIGPESCPIDEAEILLDFRFNVESTYDIRPAGNPAYRRVENIPVVSSGLFCQDGTPINLAERRAAREQLYSESLRAEFRLAAGGLSDLAVQTKKLSANRQALYTRYGDLELCILADPQPLRGLLPTLAGVWASSLLFTLAAGGMVCREMRRVYDRQAALDQNRRHTANALAHDLKTPLTLIRGYAENIRFGVRPEKHPHYLAQLQRETERMDSLLSGFLELSRLETGTLPLHREPLSLLPFAEENASAFRAAAEAKNVSLTVSGGGVLSADRELLERALGNLLSNALRHTPEGGQIAVTVSPAEITVENTGEPIPPEAPLFEAYYTGDRARGGNRHGLGLAIVRAIAELHGLRVSAENTETGVRFRLIRKS